MPKRTPEHNAKIGAAIKAPGVGASATKRCPRCEQELPRASFGVRSDGYTQSLCRPCQKAYDREKSKRHWDRHPEKRHAIKRAHQNVSLRRYHGITIEQYERMLAAQDERCAICRCTVDESGRARFDVDHCHETDAIRGLLCSKCNTAIGLLRDDPNLLRAAVEYVATSADRWPDIVRGAAYYNGRRQLKR